MSERRFRKLFPSKIGNLKESDLPLKTHSHEILETKGVARVRVYYNNQTVESNLYVVRKDGPTLFEREWLRQIQIDWPSIKSVSTAVDKVSDSCNDSVKLNLKDMLEKHKSVFQSDLGSVKGIEATLNLKPVQNQSFAKRVPCPTL